MTTPRWIATSPTAVWHERSPLPTQREPDLVVTDGHRQVMEGFGACFNEIGWQTLLTLPDPERRRILEDLFDPITGCGFRIGRVPIGASDFALEWYSANEHDGDLAMEHFSISHDERLLIPFVRAALAIQPDLTLLASPWSPPTWMKEPRVHNGGHLRWEPQILTAYALYLRRFIEAYRARGLSIRQLHVQNEPDSAQVFPSCVWTGAKLRDFIRDYLGPTFRSADLPCEIWVGTLERADYDAWAHVILRDPVARGYVSGVGYQWAGKGAVQRTHESWPELRIWQSENECGDGTNAWSYAHYVFNLVHHYLSNGASAYLYWNMVLPPGGSSTWGWAQNSLITIDPANGALTYNPEFYVMKHLAPWAAPGSVGLDLAGSWSANALAFRTPAREVALVCANPLSDPVDVVVEVAGRRWQLLLEPQSFHTLSVG